MTVADISNAVNAVINAYPNGSRIGFSGVEVGQCPAPTYEYLARLGAPIVPMANARADGWGTNFPSELAPYFDHEAFQLGKQYPEGTIYMWNSPHIAFLVAPSDGSNTVKVFEQNADPDGAGCQVFNRTLNTSTHTCTYVLVPITDAPAPVVPVGPPYTVEDITPKQVITKTQPTEKWGMNYDNLPAMQAHPITSVDAGTIMTVVAIVHHNTGGSYYRTDVNDPDGWNVDDFNDYTPTAPLPPAAPVTYTPAETYILVAQVPTYSSSETAKNKRPSVGFLPAGTYYVFSTVDGMKQLTTNNAKESGIWVNPTENKVPDPTTQPLPTSPVQPGNEADSAWKASFVSFNENRKPVKFMMLKDFIVTDFTGNAPKRKIKQYTELNIYGTFLKDGVEFGRLKTALDTDWQFWYGIPMVNANGSDAGIVEEEQKLLDPTIDTYTRKQQKNLTPKHYAILGLDAVEQVVKSIDGIFKRKKK